jgi:hypothetical protein
MGDRDDEELRLADQAKGVVIVEVGESGAESTMRPDAAFARTTSLPPRVLPRSAVSNEREDPTGQADVWSVLRVDLRIAYHLARFAFRRLSVLCVIASPRPACSTPEHDGGREAQQPPEQRSGQDDPDEGRARRADRPVELDAPRVHRDQDDEHGEQRDEDDGRGVEASPAAEPAKALRAGLLRRRRSGRRARFESRCGWSGHSPFLPEADQTFWRSQLVGIVG